MITVDKNQPDWMEKFVNNLVLLKRTYPFRIIFLIRDKDTKIVTVFADHDKRRLNRALRAGHTVVTLEREK